MKNFKFYTVLISIVLFQSGTCLGWGEKGHNMVSVLAVELLKTKVNDNPKIARPFESKMEMLGHISNIPDIHWRSLGKKVSKVGNPAHYIDWEYLNIKPSFKTIPMDWKKVQKLYDANCNNKELKNDSSHLCPKPGKGDKKFYISAGYNPWRVEQFYNETIKELNKAAKAKKRKELSEPINQAMLYWGLMSHFVADLSNPLHNTSDYDGWDVNQGKIHSYFETIIVSKLKPKLFNDVYQYALKKQPAKEVYKKIPKNLKKNPLAMTLALSFASYEKKEKLLALDKKHALISGSKIEGKKRIKSKRKPAEDVKKYFEAFIISQLAVAADVLSDLWILSWEQSGKPDLSGYSSYKYHFMPEFIEPDFK